MRFRLCVALLPLVAVGAVAKADTVFFSQPYGNVGGYLSSTGGYQEADDFTLASNSTINGVSFYGFYGTSAPAVDEFTLNIFSSANGTPGTLLDTITTVVSKTNAGSTVPGYPLFLFSSTIPAFLATAGTTYFFQTLSTSANSGFAWSLATEGNATHEIAYPHSSTYSSIRDHLAFNLFNTNAVTAATPEPSSLALLGTGVLGEIGAVRRRMA